MCETWRKKLQKRLKSINFVQGQKNFARSHNRTTARFRNSVFSYFRGQTSLIRDQAGSYILATRVEKSNPLSVCMSVHRSI